MAQFMPTLFTFIFCCPVSSICPSSKPHEVPNSHVARIDHLKVQNAIVHRSGTRNGVRNLRRGNNMRNKAGLLMPRLMGTLSGGFHRLLLFFTFMGLTVASPSVVSALSLSFDPESPTVSAGASFTVDVNIAGLHDSDPDEILSSFVLNVSFDSSLLNPQNVTFGSFLGGPDNSSQDFFFDLSTTSGVVTFAETSHLSDSDLDLLQPDNFSLATLTFEAIGEGNTLLSFSYADLVGLDFEPLPVTEGGLGSADVAIQPATNVPEPGTLMLMASGLVFFAARRRNRKTMNSK